MKEIHYDRAAAADYAKAWALRRNPAYFNFDGVGGDCTNFASQCLYAGCGVMNYTRDTGWYYNSPTDRAAAWSDAQYFHDFLIRNTAAGPVATDSDIRTLRIGDFISLWNGSVYYHTLVVAGFTPDMEPLVCAHTDDAYMRRLHTYSYILAQGVHILGANR